MSSIFMRVVLSTLFLLVFIVTPSFADSGTVDTSKFKFKPVITFKTLPNGVSVRKIVIQPDKRLVVPMYQRTTFRVYIRNNNIIAFSWTNLFLGLNPDPIGTVQHIIPGILKKFKLGLLQVSTYRFIAVLDVDPKRNVSGVFYSPTFFPPGMTSADLKW